MKPVRLSRDSGFTLMELLVVISIIGVLCAIALPAMFAARKHSKLKACLATINQLDTALTSYEQKFGDYPPSGGFVKGANEINQGNESLVWHLFTTQKGGPFLDMSTWEKDLGNGDADVTAKPPDSSAYMKTDLVELCDQFKNPFVYFHSRDYSKPTKYGKYTIAGQEVECVPQKSPKTGNYHAPGKYMIWSAGGDDENQNGGEEDVATWN